MCWWGISKTMGYPHPHLYFATIPHKPHEHPWSWGPSFFWWASCSAMAYGHYSHSLQLLAPSTPSAKCAEGTTSWLSQSLGSSWRAVTLLPLRKPTCSSQSQPGPCRFSSGSSWQSPWTAQPPAAGLSGPGTPSLWQPGSRRRGDAAAAPCPAAAEAWNSQTSPACLQTGIEAHIQYVKMQVYSRRACMKMYFTQHIYDYCPIIEHSPDVCSLICFPSIPYFYASKEIVG